MCVYNVVFIYQCIYRCLVNTYISRLSYYKITFQETYKELQMILTITKNNNKLELKNSNYNILTIDILPDNISINDSLVKNSTPNPYSSVIKKIKDDMYGAVRLIVDQDLINNYSKEIMLMLSNLNFIKHWDSRFWSKINNTYNPIVKNIKNYLSSLY